MITLEIKNKVLFILGSVPVLTGANDPSDILGAEVCNIDHVVKARVYEDRAGCKHIGGMWFELTLFEEGAHAPQWCVTVPVTKAESLKVVRVFGLLWGAYRMHKSRDNREFRFEYGYQVNGGKLGQSSKVAGIENE